MQEVIVQADLTTIGPIKELIPEVAEGIKDALRNVIEGSEI